MTLLVGGDDVPHTHTLPPIPTRPGRKFVGSWIDDEIQLENAVARCETCPKLFVSRADPDGWGRHVYWVPLRFWHFTARRKLRETKI